MLVGSSIKTRYEIRCPKCGSSLLEKNQDGDLECGNCGKVLYQQPYIPSDEVKAQNIIVKKNGDKPNIIPQKRVKKPDESDKTTPVFVDRLGRKYYNAPPGRKRTGEWRECSICGTPIYIRPYQLKLKRKIIGEYCADCRKKHLQRIFARLPRKGKFSTKLKTAPAHSEVPQANVNTELTEEEKARRCLNCDSLKSRGGTFYCKRKRCKYKDA